MSKERNELAATCRTLAPRLDATLHAQHGKRIGFVLMIFDFGAGGELAYVSNAEREGAISAVKEWLARQEAGLTTDPPGPRASRPDDGSAGSASEGLMNDIERARKLREDALYLASEKRSLALAGELVALLPRDHTWPERFVALMIAVIWLADTLKIDRSACVEAFTKLAENCRELEVEGLEV